MFDTGRAPTAEPETITSRDDFAARVLADYRVTGRGYRNHRRYAT